MASRPNILMIQTDSHDGRLMGCLGHPALEGLTPNMDRLAHEGVLFSTTYCNNPMCCPSRSSMWTGLYTHHIKAWNNYVGVPEGHPILQERLDESGYDVGLFGKQDYRSGAHTVRARIHAWTRAARIMRPAYRMPGPEVLDSQEREVHGRDWGFVREASAFLHEHCGSDSPFFCYTGLHGPHPRFYTSRYYYDMIDPEKVEMPPEDKIVHPTQEYHNLSKNWEHGTDRESVLEIRRIYYAMIVEIDHQLAELLRAVDETGLAEETVVLFTSDHGEMNMEHGTFFKSSAYDSSTRVPLIVRGPGVRAGERIDRCSSLVDIYPTVAELAGLDLPDDLDGWSLVPDLRGEPSEHPDQAFAEIHDTGCETGVFMLRSGEWKYVAYPGYEPQLFHVPSDPYEVDDLHRERPEIVRELDAELHRIVDVEAVDAEAKAYDREAFARWREERKAAGDYEEQMALVYSGWDGLKERPDLIQPWTDADEARITAWLEDAGAS
jgi:arylsulfatase A-like enzyme